MRIWTANEIAYLTENYVLAPKDELILYLNRSWSSIQNKAFLLSLKRDVANANSQKLMNGSNEAYYWLGFMVADGHFNENKQLQVNLGHKDLNHLQKFAKFVEYKGTLIRPSINIDYGNINQWLQEQFSIKHNKTYRPCVLNNMTGDKFFSFIIGFIDGDGSISSKGYLKIKCHKSWMNNINLMIRTISGDNKYCGCFTKNGLAQGWITKIEIMKNIKHKIHELQLPVLDRKWERVDLNKLSKKEKHKMLKERCYDLFKLGSLPKQVMVETGISRSFVNRMYAQYKLTPIPY